ncbi:MAG TPA: hypothetical protein DCW90_16105 [Lachnospiraceae bacterium]|nr:hypothetical protein [Lachnospiraceae bacterium]
MNKQVIKRAKRESIFLYYFCVKAFIIVLFTTILNGCNSINHNPVEGAKDLTVLLLKHQQSENLNKAHELLAEYWAAYNNEEKKEFLQVLNDNLMEHDDIVDFLVQPSFIKYPMFGVYLKTMFDLEVDLGKKTPGVNAASKGLLFGSILSEYDKNNEIDKAYNVVSTMYGKLKDSSELERLEFFYAFRRFTKEGGESGDRAYKLLLKLNTLNKGSITDFLMLALESTIDFEEPLNDNE